MISEFVKKTGISHIPSKALDISSDSVWVPPDLLKALIILSDKTIRRAVVDLEKLVILEIRKEAIFLKWSIVYNFFKDFAFCKKSTNRVAVFICKPHPNILKHKDNKWDLTTIWEMRFFQTCMFESSGLQLFRTTTGIQSGPDAFDMSILADLFKKFGSCRNNM